MGHFFQSYPFDLDKTLFFFTSGRFEYRNKGYDITLEALDELNKRLKKAKSDITIVMFIVTRKDHDGIKADVLESRALMEEIKLNCNAIHEQVGQRLFYASTTNEDNKLPELGQFVDDYWRLRYRRTIQTWKTSKKPSLVTHNLTDPTNDEILNFLENSSLDNGPDQRVKIVYHPEFINTTNPLFGMEYGDFVRGCHLGIFPSYYEPWGYTPLECMARGVPSITSDLSGFGDYVNKNIPDHDENGLFVINRQGSYKEAVTQLVDTMLNFVKQDRRSRIMQRNNTENASVTFDWHSLVKHYDKTYHSLVRF
jgi:glycogen(starch) synthase